MTETQIRLGVFLGVLILMSVLEAVFPARDRVQKRSGRWLTNLSMVVIDTLAIRILFPIIAVGVAVWAETQGLGLFNVTGFPVWLEIALAVILLDILIYWQHVAFHRIPILWRLHKVHHVDRDLDATSGLRFHPVEIVLSMAIKMLAVIALGAPVLAVIIFEVVLNACAMFNHANIRIPRWLERPLRMILMTPALHRIHHSVIERETNSNYGFSVIWWDKLFRTYTDKPNGDLTLGLTEHQTDHPSKLIWSLALPFRRN